MKISVEKLQEGGRRAAAIVKQKHIDEYLKNPNICLNCLNTILPTGNQSACRVRVKNFCNRSCSAIYRNSIDVKIKYCTKCECALDNAGLKKFCDDCRWSEKKNNFLCKKKGDVKRELIATHARRALKGDKGSCYNCGYDKHVEACHIKAVKDFDDDTEIGVINNKNNLILLCPNCHWEFDHLGLEVKYQN